jgi:methylated-DNA-[protein]-cysteine S-methyltransferase
MSGTFFHCFETAIGCCGVAWGELGIKGSQLPEATPAATRERMQARFPGAVEAEPKAAAVWLAVHGVQRLLGGHSRDHTELLAVRLDESAVPPFNAQVHALTRLIPVGQTLTYGEIARRLGNPGAARAVGRAEGTNPFAPIVPCHRVLAAASAKVKLRELGGFSAPGGVATKLRLLVIEARAAGQAVGEQGCLFD